MQPEPTTLSQLMRAGNRFTDRDFMNVLGVGHPQLKQMEANPYLFSVDQLARLAGMLGKPTMLLAQLALEQLSRNPDANEQAAAALKKVTGRRIGGGGRKPSA